jgi:peptidoglycan/LPS O-acetylase OafA/YrhL
MAWLGSISYGIYLWHESWLQLISPTATIGPAPRPLPATLALFLATVAGAIALGAASWYLVERPAQRRWRPRPRAAVALAS